MLSSNSCQKRTPSNKKLIETESQTRLTLMILNIAKQKDKESPHDCGVWAAIPQKSQPQNPARHLCNMSDMDFQIWLSLKGQGRIGLHVLNQLILVKSRLLSIWITGSPASYSNRNRSRSPPSKQTQQQITSIRLLFSRQKAAISMPIKTTNNIKVKVDSMSVD